MMTGEETSINTHGSGDLDSFSRSIFAPDPLLRFQYDKVHQSKASSPDDHGMRELMLAVLENGIACYQSYFFRPSRTNAKLFREAEEWINSEDDGVFSFNGICETLDLDPAGLRRGLVRALEGATNKRASRPPSAPGCQQGEMARQQATGRLRIPHRR